MKSLKRKNNLKTLSAACAISLLNCFSLSGALANSNVQSTDISTGAILIPWKFIDSWVQSKMVSNGSSTLIDEKIGNLDFTVADIPVHISSARLQASGGFAPIEVSQNVTRWQTQLLDVNVSLSGFEVEKEFVKDVDGATIIIKLKAQCAPFTLKQEKSHFSTDIAWRSQGGGFNVEAQHVDLTWPENSWLVDKIECQGPEGFGEVVQKELSSYLQNPTAIAAQLKPLMESRINQFIAQIMTPLQMPTWLDNNKIFSVQTSGTQVVPDQGLVILASLNISSEYQENLAPQNVDLTLYPELWTTVKDQPVLVLPKKFFEVTARHAKIFPRLTLNLREIPEFRRIMKSRILQFLFWPELLKFKKTADFEATSLVQGQGYAFPANSPKIEFLGNGKISLKTSISTWVKAVRDNDWINWAYINTDVSGAMNYSISNGEMMFRLEKPSLNITAQHQPEYLAKYPNKHKFPISRIRGPLQNQLMGRSFKFAIPSLDLRLIGAKNHLKAVGVEENRDNLVFSFAPIEF